MPDELSFDQLYHQQLETPLRELEKKRISVREWHMGAIGVFIIAVLMLLAGISNSGNRDWGGMGLPVFLAFAAAIILFLVANSKRTAYATEYKNKIIRQIIALINPSFTYQPRMRIAPEEYKRSGLFLHSYDSYGGDDYVEGKQGATAFRFSELNTSYRVQTGKSSTTVTIFKGLFFIADFNKNFSGRTYVWSENNAQLNFFNKLFGGFSSGLEKVLLESPEFERRFIVYSNDQVESRYILSPSMMEKMVHIQDQFNRDVVFSFVDSHIYIAIPWGENMFEPTVFKAPDQEGIRTYYNLLRAVVGMIDELGLNNRIWNKE